MGSRGTAPAVGAAALRLPAPGRGTAPADGPPGPSALPADTIAPCPDTPSQQVLDLVNAARADAHLPLFQVDLRLVTAARVWAVDMDEGGPTGHVGSDGSVPETRVMDAGYGYQLVGENVAAGMPSAAEVMKRWMGSEHHRANILDGRFRDIGIAYIGDSLSRYGSYWVQVFGTLMDTTQVEHKARCNPGG